ncbi:hypothetical protein LTR10_006869 [Elasticomyces elasticus]|nr:hypothetical protein LTR10_006869 [Elasticomyces elasticus]KAK4972728.1 hypothetical protein LTR42_006022 [Elasticomyces elasticus]
MFRLRAFMLLLFLASLSSASPFDIWAKYRILISRYSDDICSQYLSEIDAKGEKIVSGQCKTWDPSESFPAFQYQYAAHKGDDVPYDKEYMISIYEEPHCNKDGRHERFNATSQMLLCIHDAGTPGHNFDVRSLGIDCVGGNGYRDHDKNYDPRQPEDWHQ